MHAPGRVGSSKKDQTLSGPEKAASAGGCRTGMDATKGVLIEAEPALCQHIRHLDEQKKKDAQSFIMSVLDERHLLVKEEYSRMIQSEIKALQSKNHFSKNAEAQLPNS